MGAPGFDDSPMAQLTRGVSPKPVTFIYPYYENPKFLTHQLEVWNSYDKGILDNLSVFVIDDGSPKNPAETVLRGVAKRFPLRLFRIEVDVRWNWLAARNIGMHRAFEGWCVMTDMDHVIDADVARHLMWDEHNPDVVYRFSRREHTGAKIHPHPNSMFMTRQSFWLCGGYDEALSGHYGTDGDWRRRISERRAVRLLEQELVRYEYVDDSSTTRYKRKQPEDAGKKRIIASRRKGWKPKVLSFPYHEVDLCSM